MDCRVKPGNDDVVSKRSRSRGALFTHPSFAARRRETNDNGENASAIKEAERRKAHPTMTACAAARQSRGALAFRRSTAALAPATERQDSAQAALHADAARGRYPRHHRRLSGAPRAPVVVPEGTMPRPPGSEVTNPARRNRARPTDRLSPVDVPSMSGILCSVSEKGTNVK
jgi:hypothetical protein